MVDVELINTDKKFACIRKRVTSPLLLPVDLTGDAEFSHFVVSQMIRHWRYASRFLWCVQLLGHVHKLREL